MKSSPQIQGTKSSGKRPLPHPQDTETARFAPSHQATAAVGLEKMKFILKTLRAKKIPMSSLNAVILIYQDQKGQMSLTGLSNKLEVTTAAVTSVADTLERLGFARRRTNPLDRRLTWINLTPRGIAFAEWLNLTLVCPTGPVEKPVSAGIDAGSRI
jgi:DNA-binding MarR family transcriptional regulator